MIDCRDPWPPEELELLNALIRLGLKVDPAPGSVVTASGAIAVGVGEIRPAGPSNGWVWQVYTIRSDDTPCQWGRWENWEHRAIHSFVVGRPLYYCEAPGQWNVGTPG